MFIEQMKNLQKTFDEKRKKKKKGLKKKKKKKKKDLADYNPQRDY